MTQKQLLKKISIQRTRDSPSWNHMLHEFIQRGSQQLMKELMKDGRRIVSLEEVLQWSQSFEKLITSKYGPMIYKIYLKTEHSDENIEFWLACEAYKKITSQRKRISVARKLFTSYIQPDAPNEINIDSPARKAIIRNMQEPTESCFDEAQRIIYMHMERDSYPRFLESKFYQKLKHSLQTKSSN